MFLVQYFFLIIGLFSHKDPKRKDGFFPLPLSHTLQFTSKKL